MLAMREDLLEQRGKFMFHIEQTKRHFIGLESGAIQIINGKANLPAAEIQILNQLFIDHFAWEIDMLSEAITLIGSPAGLPRRRRGVRGVPGKRRL